MPRLFVAIDLPEEQRRYLESIYIGLPAETRWTPPEQLHLTMRFIGEVDDRLSLLIKTTLSAILFVPLSLQIKGLGCFPARRHPKILWAGVEKNLDLEQLQIMIENQLVQLGLTPEVRKFHPHFTIARLPPQIAPETIAAYLARNSQETYPPFRVNSLYLYSSLLTRYGALHQIEGTYSAR